MTEKLEPKKEDWKLEGLTPDYKQPLLADMVQLARQQRVNFTMTREEIVDAVIRGKMQNISVLEEAEMCSMNQIKSEKLEKAFPKLVSFVDKKDLKGSRWNRFDQKGSDWFRMVRMCQDRSRLIRLGQLVYLF